MASTTRTSEEVPRPQLSPAKAHADAALRLARRAAHHERGKVRLLVPFGWLASLHGAAAVLHVTGAPAVWATAGILLGAVVVLGLAERRGAKSPWAFAGVGSAWMILAVLAGPTGWVAWLWWGGGVIASAPYWWRLRARPKRQPVKEIEAAPEVEPVNAAVEQKIWAERVVPHEQAFKLTHLEDVRPVPNGYTALIVGEPGPTRFSKMTTATAIEAIASASRVRHDLVAVEQTGTGDASQARLTVIRSDDNLIDAVYLEDSGAAIDPATGIAQIGRFMDMTPTHHQFWTLSGGAMMRIVAGDTKSGKSNHVAGLISLAHRSDKVATILLDPQDGASQPDWKDRTHVYGEGVDATFENILMLDFVMQRRGHFVAHAPWADDQGRERTGKPYLLPGDPDLDGMPMLLIIVEELKLFFDSEYGKEGFGKLSTGVRTWRKPGGGLLVVNQNLGLENFFNSQSFRSNLISGGGVTALRTGSSTDHSMVGLPADPSKLPAYFPNGAQTHGLGYTLGVDRRPAAQMRTNPVRDAFGIACTPPAGQIDDRTLGWMEEWREQRRRGREPKPSTKSTPEPVHTSGDVQATVEEVLREAPRPLEVGAIVVAVQKRIGAVKLAEVPAALRALIAADVVQQHGDQYRLIP